VPSAHWTPQPPQLSASALVFTQTPPHAVWSAGHVAHVLLTQTPLLQTVGQVPQCCGSVLRSTQVPAQSVVPPLQAHTPLTQW